MKFTNTTIAVVVLCLLTASCGWEQKLSFQARDGSKSIQLLQPFPANGWGLEVRLITRADRRTLYRARGDVFLEFAQVYWSPDNKTVAIFTCGTPALRMAYKIRANAEVPFLSVENNVQAAIKETYAGQYRSGDALEWACSYEGKQAFYRRYPDAASR